MSGVDDDGHDDALQATQTQPSRPLAGTAFDSRNSTNRTPANGSRSSRAPEGLSPYSSMNTSGPYAQQFGRYVVEGELGRGGMSVVYRAHDPSLDRPVAVKVMHPHLADREDARIRFAREARAIARLPHPNIVEIYDHAPAMSERAYIVTELIDGPTLRTFVDGHPVRFGEVAALLMIPVLEALNHAHKAGIVHRDIKPENIMLRADGTPVLMDFGIAQMVDQDTLTATGTMLGSPAHMAPEIVEGEDITVMADIFSVGTVLYWLVCGALPFSGPSPAALFRRIAECRFDPVLHRKPQAGRAIARLIEQCMSHAPTERPDSAGAIAETLRQMLEQGGLTDPATELVAFLKDPEVYQDALGRRLVPAYVATAEVAYGATQTARALDYLDRALAIEEDHEGARALLARIERGRRHGRTLKLFGVCAAAALIAAAIVHFWPVSTALPVVSVGGGIASALVTDAPAIAPESIAARQPPSAPVMSVETASVGTVAPVSVASAAPETMAKAPVTAAPKAPRTKAPRSVAKRQPRSTAPVSVASAAPETEPPVPATQVRILPRSTLKGTNVYVDGVLMGNIVKLSLKKGFVVDAGQTYTVSFSNTGCINDDPHTLRIPAGTQGSRQVVHDCRFKPAYIKVWSNEGSGKVFQNGSDYLGPVGQRIRIKMNKAERDLTLTVGAKDKQRDMQVTVFAGQERTVRVKF